MVAVATVLLALLLAPVLLSPGAARLSIGPATPGARPAVAGSAVAQPAAAAAADADRDHDAGPSPSAAVLEQQAHAAALGAARTLLQGRTAAVAARDAALWSSASSDPGSAAAEFSVLASLPVTRFDAHVVADTLERVPAPGSSNADPGEAVGQGDPGERWRAHAVTTYQLGESLTVRREDTFELVPAGGGWQLAAWQPYPSDGAVAPWQLGPVVHVTGARAVVLAWPTAAEAAAGAPGLHAATDRATQALLWVQAASAEVDDVLGTAWPRTSLVLVPGTGEQYSRLVPGEQPLVDDVYAAVTADTATPGATGDVVVLNPAARDELDADTWQVTVTHELVHVASGALHGDDQPLWLSEGLADVVGWSSLVRRPADRDRVAGRLLDRVLTGQGPERLADREQFTSDDPDVVGDAYDGSWLAALMLLDRVGQEGLLSLYAATSSGEGTPEERFDAALQQQVGIDAAAFEQEWLDYLAGLAADSPNR